MVTICHFEIYSGKDGENVMTNPQESVVITLARELVGGNYHLFDNYFATVPSLEKLLKDEIYACGTF